MNRKLLLIVLLLAGGTGAYMYTQRPPAELVLTGIVTADEVVVSPQMAGRLSKLLVAEGDTVTANQILAVLEPGELKADRAFFARSAEAVESQVQAGEAELSASMAQEREAQATLAQAKLAVERTTALVSGGALSQREQDDARTAYEVAQARAAAAERQVAKGRSAIMGSRQQQQAAKAQSTKADVRLAYAEVPAPISGIVDVRAARVGEVVTPGQPILTLINPDSLWVRADVEESYIDRIRLGEKINVRLPSGDIRPGTVFYRGVDAEFATQRDVSRTKRDIKTFQIRLRLDNHDRRLAVGMTAYVLVPSKPSP